MSPSEMPAKPNILFIMADQFRADALGCAGGWTRTPNLDRIAARGLRFENCVTTSPICIPARVSLASGLYPHNTGLWTNKGFTMPPVWRTWMAAIRDAGYRTSVFGKTHLHRHGGNQDLRDCEHLLHAYGLDDVDETTGPHAAGSTRCRMTDLWEEKGVYTAFKDDLKYRQWGRLLSTQPSPLGRDLHYDTYVGQAASDYLKSYQRNQPWFCWVSFGGPHEPWDAPEPYNTMFSPDTMPAPLPRIQSATNRPTGGLDEHFAQYDKRQQQVSKIPLNEETSRNLRANYAGKIALIDNQIGMILNVLEARGELENTIIVFTSDHGEMNGDHNLIFKSCFLDGAARIPMLVSTPDMRKKGTTGVCMAPVELIDVGPTLAELAGAKLEYEQFGISLVPTLTDPATVQRQEAICEFEGDMMMLTPEWKAAINREGRLYLLIDRQADPGEQHNLAGLPRMKPVEDALRLRLLERLSTGLHQIPLCGFIAH
jgi:arylsulfatase